VEAAVRVAAECSKCGKYFTRADDEGWKKLCFSCWVAAKPEREGKPEAKPETIEPEMLRRLIQLCHPDRHNGSEASLKASQFLLAIKGKR
jgi:hypothetical protein